MSREAKRDALEKLALRSPYLKSLVRRVMPDMVEDQEASATSAPKAKHLGLKRSYIRDSTIQYKMIYIYSLVGYNTMEYSIK